MSTLTISTLFQWFKQDFIKISLIGIVFGAISVVYALSLPNVYSTKTIVISNLSEGGMGGSLSKLGGLASIAGVSLGGGKTTSPEVLSETIKSNSFLAEFIRSQEIEIELMAAKDFDPASGKFLLNEKIYDADSNTWVRDYKYPQTLAPSDIELVEKFKDVFGVNFARKTKLITLNFKSYSPEQSQKIPFELVKFFNEYMRAIDIKEATSTVAYLEDQLVKANAKEVKIALQQILEEQFKKLALANTRDEYAFKIIEAPLYPANKSEPKRAIICVVITILGTALTIMLWWSVRIFRQN